MKPRDPLLPPPLPGFLYACPWDPRLEKAREDDPPPFPPGVKVARRGAAAYVTAPIHAAWLVEAQLAAWGLQYSVSPLEGADGPPWTGPEAWDLGAAAGDPPPEFRSEWAGRLHPFQRAGIAAAARRPGILFRYPTGTGKTITGVAAALAAVDGPVAVVAPAKARDVWAQKPAEYTGGAVEPFVILPEGRRNRAALQEYLAVCRGELPGPTVYETERDAIPYGASVEEGVILCVPLDVKRRERAARDGDDLEAQADRRAVVLPESGRALGGIVWDPFGRSIGLCIRPKPGAPATYSAIRAALEEALSACLVQQPNRPLPSCLVIPALGCGDGGPDADIEYGRLKEIILEVFRGWGGQIVICTPGRKRGPPTPPTLIRAPKLQKQRPVVVAGLEVLGDYLPDLLAIEPEAVIFDEIHLLADSARLTPIPRKVGEACPKCKVAAGRPCKRWCRGVAFGLRMTDEGGRMTRAAAAMVLSRHPSVKRRIGLTATSLGAGKTARWWGLADLLWPGTWGTYREHTQWYCNGHYNEELGFWDDKGCSNLDQLKARSLFFTQDVPVEVTDKLLPPLTIDIVRLSEAQLNDPDPGAKKWAAAAARLGRSHGRTARMVLASQMKRKWCVGKAIEALQSGQKVVIFSALRTDCEFTADAVTRALHRLPHADQRAILSLKGHGGVSEVDRSEMGRRFERWQGPAILVATGHAFGTSIDTLKDMHLLILQLIPTEADNWIQWVGRGRRFGGTPLLVVAPFAEGTEDDRLFPLLAEAMQATGEFQEGPEGQLAAIAARLRGSEAQEALLDRAFAKMSGDDWEF